MSTYATAFAARLSVTGRVTVNWLGPVTPYSWVTVFSVDVPPSPKVQACPARLPPWSKLVLIKVQTAAMQLYVNLAVGGGFVGGTGSTVIVWVSMSVQPSLSVTVRVTVNGVATVT